MNKTPCISIIITVFNAETKLHDYFHGILFQSLRENHELEIICVNQGSSDCSLEIMQDFAKKYPCVKVIDQIAITLPQARNIGFECATGDLIYYIDPETRLDLMFLEEINSLMTLYPEVDYIMFSLYGYIDNPVDTRLPVNSVEKPEGKKCHSFR